MKKRKVFNSEIATSKRPRTKTISKDDQLTPPGKGLSKAEIQELIQTQILAKLKQSDEKMDELIGRIQKIECISNYEGRLYKLQADITKIKRRTQAAVAYMRKLQPSGTEMSPEELNQRASCNSIGSEPSYIMDSAASMHVSPGPVPSETTVSDHTDVVSSTSETESSTQDCTEVQEETEDVVFCGVMLPKKSIVEGFCQKQNPTSCHTHAAGVLVPMQADSLAIGQGAGILRMSTLGAPPPSSHTEGDWLLKLPPLPAISLPNYLPSEASINQPPQLCLTVKPIEMPEGIGLRWTAIEEQPCTLAGQLFPLLHPGAQLRLLLEVEQHRSDKGHAYSHDL